MSTKSIHTIKLKPLNCHITWRPYKIIDIGNNIIGTITDRCKNPYKRGKTVKNNEGKVYFNDDHLETKKLENE